MQTTRYILPALGVALAGALVVLVLKVRGSPAVEIDEKKLAQAEASYKRRENTESSSPVLPRARARTAPERPTQRVNAAPPPAPENDGEVTAADSPFRKAPEVSVSTAPDQMLKVEMDAANKLYDKGDYPGAEEAALEILKDNPRNIRMLRIVVSTSCIMGNAEQAQQYLAQLPNRDQTQMRKRCSHWGTQVPETE